MLVAVLVLRFLVELALFAGAAVAAAELVSSGVGRVLLGVLGCALVVALWSILLSPKRPTNLALPARVVIELALFIVVGGGLWAAGFEWAGGVLLGLDVLVLIGLFALGDEPGRHFDPSVAGVSD